MVPSKTASSYGKVYHEFVKKCIYHITDGKIVFSKEFRTRVNIECCYAVYKSIKSYLNELRFHMRSDENKILMEHK